MISISDVREPVEAPLLQMLQQERGKALSAREWKFRLAGYGYAIKKIAGRDVLTRLPNGQALGVVPAHMA